MESTISTSLEAQRKKSLRYKKTAGYYLAFMAMGLVASVLGPTLPGLAEHTRSDLSAISYLFTARALGYLLGSLISGRLYDRVAGHRLMVTVLVVMTLTLLATPLISLLWLLTLVMLILGLAEGSVDVGGNTLLVWEHGHAVGPFMNGLHFFFGLGAFLSPIIVAQALIFSGDIRWAYWTLAALVLPALVWLVWLPSPQQPAESHQASIDGRIDFRLVALIAAFLFLYVGAEVSFGGWIFTYARALNLADEAVAAYLASAFWGALTVGRLISVPLATRLRPRTTLIIDLAGCLLSIGLVYLGRASLIMVSAGALGLGFFMASIFPTTISLAERRMTITGQVTGLFFVGSGMGGMVLPWLIGQLFEPVGPQVMVFAILLDLLLAAGVFSILIIAPQGKRSRTA